MNNEGLNFVKCSMKDLMNQKTGETWGVPDAGAPPYY